MQHGNPMSTHFAPERTASAAIAFSQTLPLLAAGTLPSPGLVPSLSILRASPTGLDGERELFSAVDTFASPAAFRSICWSAASSYTSAAGFVAGGLEGGVVAVWDSRTVRDLAADSSEEVDVHDREVRNYFSPSREPAPEAPAPAPLPRQADAEEDDDSDSDSDYDDLADDMDEDQGRAVLYGRKAWRPPCLSQRSENKVRRKSPATSHGEAVAHFQHENKSPVCGVSFNWVEPHILASTAGNRVVLWDISARSASVRSLECVAPAPSACISWSRSRDLVACASNEGTTTLFDIRTKSPAINSPAELNLNRPCSCIEFSPNRENELVVSFGDSSHDPSLWCWDMNNMSTPLWKACNHSRGITSLSWNQMEDLILFGTKRSRINTFSPKYQKIISELSTPTPCLDLKWSNVERGSFVTSFDRKLVAYAME